MSGGRSLVVRADAGAGMGTGHVMRCLALAAVFRGDGPDARAVHFACASLPEASERRLLAHGLGVHRTGAEAASAEDAAFTVDLARRSGADWVVVDGYAFDGAYEEALRREGLRVLALDDYGHTRHTADVVLNQNLHATRAPYEPVPGGTRLLLGPEFALLRPEFRRWRGAHRTHASPLRKVLVTLGGSDPQRVAPRVIDGLAPLGLDARLLLGGADDAAAETERRARDAGFDVVRDAADVSEHMAWADVAVASAGVTLLELLFMGTPSLLVVVAENQRSGALVAEAQGLAGLLGFHTDVTAERVAAAVSELRREPDRARQFAERGRAAVDGRGAERVCEALGVG